MAPNFLKEFSTGDGVKVTEMTPSHTYLKSSETYPSLKERIAKLTDDTSTATRASAVEFILEGLAISGKIKKEISENDLTYGTKK